MNLGVDQRVRRLPVPLEALTRAVQERLAQATPQDGGPGTSNRQREHPARAKQEKKAQVVVIDDKETAA